MIVYIPLLDEGTDVWRPAEAIHVRGSLYRIVSAAVPESERWRFRPGDVVRVERRNAAEGESLLVAVERDKND